MKSLIGAALIVLLAAAPFPLKGPAPAPDAGWKRAEEGYRWSMPNDHWPHPDYRLEWWYLTGHLQSSDHPERRFGYQLTLFRVGLSPGRPGFDSDWSAANLLMGHAAITDKSKGEHRFSDLLFREAPFLAGFNSYPEPLIAWSRAPVGTDGRWELRWNGGGFDIAVVDTSRRMAFSLQTRPLKPMVFQGPGGFSRKAAEPGAASLYYSFTRLVTDGTLSLDGESWTVTGQSWMDHEFSTSHLGEGQVGWDWISLQLDGGQELMLYVMRRKDGAVDFTSGTLVSSDGAARYLAPGEWSVKSTATWRSPESGIEYPSGWTVEVPGVLPVLRVTPEVAGQENVSRMPAGLFYWEGAVRVSGMDGASLGLGYVELTGYGKERQPS